jgi:hypothetical protein
VPGIALEPGGIPLVNTKGEVIGAMALVSLDSAADGRAARNLAVQWRQRQQQAQAPRPSVHEQPPTQQQQGPPAPGSRGASPLDDNQAGAQTQPPHDQPVGSTQPAVETDPPSQGLVNLQGKPLISSVNTPDLPFEESTILFDVRGRPLPTRDAVEWAKFKKEFPAIAEEIRSKLQTNNTSYSGVQALHLAQTLGVTPLQAADVLVDLTDPIKNRQPNAPLIQGEASLTPQQQQQIYRNALDRAATTDFKNKITGGGRWIADPDHPTRQYWAQADASEPAVIARARARYARGWESLPLGHPNRSLTSEPGQWVADPLQPNVSYWLPQGASPETIALARQTRTASVNGGNATGMVDKIYDGHVHNRPYDPYFVIPYDNMGRLLNPLQRMLNLGEGNQTKVNVFPVAPGLNPSSRMPYGQRRSDGSPGASYYGLQGSDFSPMVGRATRTADRLWRLEGVQSELYRGQQVRLPEAVVTQDEIELALGRPLPDNLDHFDFAVLPVNCHAGMSYAGVEPDSKLMEETLKLPPEQRSRVYQGITAGDPFANYSDREVWNALRTANALELQHDGKLGALNLNGLGEITIAKELVMETVGRNPLFLSSDDELAHLSKYLSTMEQAGGLAIIHCDAGSAYSVEGRVPMLPSDNSNIARLETLLSSHPDLQVIWAHGGGLGRTVRPGSGHLNMLRGMLDRHPNLQIDTSWDVINAYMIKTPQAMRDWAKLVHEYPDRFIFGSDAVAAGMNPNPNAQFSGIDMLARSGFFNELNALDMVAGKELRSSTAKLLFGNFDNTIAPAAARVTAWRTHPAVAEWLQKKGYDKGELPPMTYQRDASGELVLKRANKINRPFWQLP